jgi:FkbM family methyltransferase
VVVTALFGVFLLLALPDLRVALLFLAGRAGACSVTATFAGVRNLPDREALHLRIEKASRLRKSEAGLDLWDTPHGSYWFPHNREGGEALFTILAEREQDTYGARITPGDVVLDCGANVGTYTQQALSRGAAHVVAVEPEPRVLECLRRNLAAEIAAGKVTVVAKGVWDREQALELAVDDGSLASSVVDAVEHLQHRVGKVTVELVTIDKLVADLRLDRVDLIKMNIEGAERQALAGAQGTLQRFRPRVAVVVGHLPDDPVAIPAVIEKSHVPYRRQFIRCRDRGLDLQPEFMVFEASGAPRLRDADLAP